MGGGGGASVIVLVEAKEAEDDTEGERGRDECNEERPDDCFRISRNNCLLYNDMRQKEEWERENKERRDKREKKGEPLQVFLVGVQ